MSKKVVGKIKLAPYVPAWYDAVNNIHLVRPHHTSQEIHEDMDLNPIMKGVHAGYLVFNEATQEVEQKVKESKPKKVEVDVKMDPDLPLPIKKRRSKKAAEKEAEEKPVNENE